MSVCILFEERTTYNCNGQICMHNMCVMIGEFSGGKHQLPLTKLNCIKFDVAHMTLIRDRDKKEKNSEFNVQYYVESNISQLQTKREKKTVNFKRNQDDLCELFYR